MAPRTAFKKGNPGKPKGAVNHLTKQMKTVKETVLAAFNEMQKDPTVNIVEWGKKNPKDFYIIAAKLIPTEIQAQVEGVVRALVITPASKSNGSK